MSHAAHVDAGLAELARVLADEHTRSSLTGRCDWCGDGWPCQDAAWAASYLCLLDAVDEVEEPVPPGSVSPERGERA